jgi:hypothetical protein
MRTRRTLRGEKGPPPGAMASDVEFHTLIRAEDSLPHGDQYGFHRPGNVDARRTAW